MEGDTAPAPVQIRPLRIVIVIREAAEWEKTYHGLKIDGLHLKKKSVNRRNTDRRKGI